MGILFFLCVILFQSLCSIFIILFFFLTQNFHKTTLLKYHFTSFKGFFPWWLSLQLGLPFTNSTHFSCLILFSTQLWRILSAMTCIIIPELNYFHLSLKVEGYYCSEYLYLYVCMLDAMWFLALLFSIGCGGRKRGEMSTQNCILIHGRANFFTVSIAMLYL